MKLLYKKEYVERVLFVVEHNGKVVFVYRSSGLSGTGHGGDILPFLYLNETNRIHEAIGYIYKEMLYDGNYKSHHKRMNLYDGLPDKMNQIKEFLKDEVAEVTFELLDDTSMDDFKEYIVGINSDLKAFEDEYKLLDLSKDF